MLNLLTKQVLCPLNYIPLDPEIINAPDNMLTYSILVFGMVASGLKYVQRARFGSLYDWLH